MADFTARSTVYTHRIPLHAVDRVALLVLGDVSVLSLVLYASLEARFVGFSRALVDSTGLRLIWWVVLLAAWLILANVLRLYNLKIAAAPAKSAVVAAIGAAVVCVVYLVIPIWSAPLTASRVTWAAFMAMSALGIVLWRGFYGKVLTHERYSRKTIVVGSGQGAFDLPSAQKSCGSWLMGICSACAFSRTACKTCRWRRMRS